LISNEKTLPYDRTLLTKTLPFGNAEKFVLRDDEYLKSADIDVKLGHSVYSIHTDKKKVVCSNGRKFDYDKLCIATGGQTIKPPIKGLEDTKNVYYLRNKADQESIKENIAKDVRQGVALIGAGFIGSESAAAIKMKYKDQFDVHLIDMIQNPMELVLGKEIGQILSLEHQKHGVKLHMGQAVKEVTRDYDGKANGVIL